MKFIFKKIDSLPRLAWCAEIKREDDYIKIYHGPWVEVTNNFFCEGAWSGDFILGNFDEEIFMGSGGKLIDIGFLVSTPNHTLDRILAYKKENILYVSNSLPFILARANDNLNPKFLFYDSLFASIKDGIKKYIRKIPTLQENFVHIYYHSNLLIKPDLKIEEYPKKPIREFTNYKDYITFVENKIKAIILNANDPLRKKKYTPITTISSGYDSAASSIFASKVGCKEAITFIYSRGEKNNIDSGEMIAKKLNMSVKTYDRLAYLNNEKFLEAEMQGGPSEFSVLEDILPQRILFTGHGGTFWDKNCSIISDELIRTDASGSAYTEFRLRVGWIHLPVPFIGGTSHHSIYNISRSDEMKPWSLFNKYDKPIPRRLLEEMGIEREKFGMSKKAVGIYVAEEGIKNTMSKKSYEDFEDYCKKIWNIKFEIITNILKTLQKMVEFNKRVNKKIEILIKNHIGITIKLPLFLPYKLRVLTYGYIGKESLLFHWGINKLLERYKIQ